MLTKCSERRCFFRDEKSASIVKFYELYRAPMQGWINMSKYKAMRRIKKAVDLDTVSFLSRDHEFRFPSCKTDIFNLYF